MGAPTDPFVAELTAAIDKLDRPLVASLCQTFIYDAYRAREPISADVAKAVLKPLRRKRFFDQLGRVADVLIHTGHESLTTRRLYAQALIDQGALAAGEAMLRPLVADARNETVELDEARGLLGRTLKQRYVEAGKRIDASDVESLRRYSGSLIEAIRWYHEAYTDRESANYWHGINAVACSARATRDRLDIKSTFDGHTIATDILFRMKALPTPEPWQLATALEACVALGDFAAATGWAVRYTKHKDADAFEIASTLRQLEEVWQLGDSDEPEGFIVPLLRGALLQRENGAIEISYQQTRNAATADASRESLERNFGNEGFASYETYTNGARRARTVARLGREVGGMGLGTGFLVRGRDLADRFKDESWLLVTNAHVVSTDRSHQPALSPKQAVVTFQALPLDEDSRVREYRVDDNVLGLSGPRELDYAVLKLRTSVSDVADRDCCEISDIAPAVTPSQRVYIIGHPRGGGLSYSIQDNLLIDYAAPKLHYRTPTEPGSSGSPIYDAQWRLIGLHHAGSTRMNRLGGKEGTYEANEGIWIQSIRSDLAQQS